jgi:hypothetical protein
MPLVSQSSVASGSSVYLASQAVLKSDDQNRATEEPSTRSSDPSSTQSEECTKERGSISVPENMSDGAIWVERQGSLGRIHDE